MWNRCVLFATAVLFGGAGCGSSPVAPISSILAGPGPYQLWMQGHSSSFRRDVPPCEPGTGTVLLSGGALIEVSKEGAQWVDALHRRKVISC